MRSRLSQSLLRLALCLLGACTLAAAAIALGLWVSAPPGVAVLVPAIPGALLAALLSAAAARGEDPQWPGDAATAATAAVHARADRAESGRGRSS
jgi:hypothetical protein